MDGYPPEHGSNLPLVRALAAQRRIALFAMGVCCSDALALPTNKLFLRSGEQTFSLRQRQTQWVGRKLSLYDG
jgi:hypothetical protein